MKIVVIEDNNDFNQIICNHVNQVIFENNLDHRVKSFTKYNNELRKVIHDKEIKIYIIDIQMGVYSGYDICREIRETAYDWDSIIIIASVHNEKENIISLRLSIFTYISKLYNFETNLKETIVHAVNILEHKKFLMINKNSKVAINDICYIMKEKKQ